MLSDVAPWKSDHDCEKVAMRQKAVVTSPRKPGRIPDVMDTQPVIIPLYWIITVRTLRMEARLFRFWDEKRSHMLDLWNLQPKLVLLRTSRISWVHVIQRNEIRSKLIFFLGFCDLKIYWHIAVKPRAKVTSLITKRGNQLLSHFPVTYNRILIEKYRRASFIGLIWWFANFVTYHPKHKVSNCNRNYLFEHCV